MARGRSTDHAGSRNKGRSRSQSKARKLKCYHCHKEGNYIKDCPELKGKKKDNSKMADARVVEDNFDGADVLSVTINCSDERWILDTGCSYHMCPKRDWFATYHSFDDSEVLMGNDVAYKGSTVTGAVTNNSSSDIDSDTTKLWHMQLGHMSERGMDVLSKQVRSGGRISSRSSPRRGVPDLVTVVALSQSSSLSSSSRQRPCRRLVLTVTVLHSVFGVCLVFWYLVGTAESSSFDSLHLAPPDVWPDVLPLYPGRLSSRTVSTVAGRISLKDSESNSRIGSPLLFKCGYAVIAYTNYHVQIGPFMGSVFAVDIVSVHAMLYIGAVKEMTALLGTLGRKHNIFLIHKSTFSDFTDDDLEVAWAVITKYLIENDRAKSLSNMKDLRVDKIQWETLVNYWLTSEDKYLKDGKNHSRTEMYIGSRTSSDGIVLESAKRSWSESNSNDSKHFFLHYFGNPRTQSYGHIKYRISNPSRKRREMDT
ncbi:hypothetical protein RJ639_037409 [Escallonia herrerae]|uniref:CCHC-type domain-containing protein n=1 Tax=Escallonia herrerae TaxID=1293975 RepID=A0AA89BGU6_9ASTE|nr:hypothetical protein RJ639_037409 [Escallonia herrerae]